MTMLCLVSFSDLQDPLYRVSIEVPTHHRQGTVWKCCHAGIDMLTVSYTVPPVLEERFTAYATFCTSNTDL